MDILQIITEINKHIAVLNDDYTAMSINVAVLQSQMTEVLWLIRAILASSIALIIAQAWKLIVKKNNNK